MEAVTVTGEGPNAADRGTPAATYGAAPHGWLVGLIGGVLLAGLVGWLAWAGLHQQRTSVQSTVVGYTVVGDHAVRIRYLVTRDPDRPVRCTLEAQDSYHEPVGRVDVAVPTGGPQEAQRSGTVATTRRAVTGLVVGCRYTD